MASTARQPVDIASARGLTIPAGPRSPVGTGLAPELGHPARGGLGLGVAPSLVAVTLGVVRSATGRGRALAAIVIGGAMLAMMVVWMVVGAGWPSPR